MHLCYKCQNPRRHFEFKVTEIQTRPRLLEDGMNFRWLCHLVFAFTLLGVHAACPPVCSPLSYKNGKNHPSSYPHQGRRGLEPIPAAIGRKAEYTLDGCVAGLTQRQTLAEDWSMALDPILNMINLSVLLSDSSVIQAGGN